MGSPPAPPAHGRNPSPPPDLDADEAALLRASLNPLVVVDVVRHLVHIGATWAAEDYEAPVADEAGKAGDGAEGDAGDTVPESKVGRVLQTLLATSLAAAEATAPLSSAVATALQAAAPAVMQVLLLATTDRTKVGAAAARVARAALAQADTADAGKGGMPRRRKLAWACWRTFSCRRCVPTSGRPYRSCRTLPFHGAA